ncbi:hypothetical protein [Arthrobacter sp. ES3-54]|jgi:hypothetical protein|uniref:hypothetical protein n=1 Tax=Arthrobacter sp. ES3-54 TaxID=1502991 RepID=UPI002405F657|nr:hypothetical protein [Arthrobacter sp. ES3-54]MDF9749560.1 hypothetical protein [Arthrobacter sp. ES3-54]
MTSSSGLLLEDHCPRPADRIYLVPGHLQRRLLPDVAVPLRPPTLNQMLVSADLCDDEWRGQIETYGELYQSEAR